MTVGIYYATTTGKTEDVADRLHNFISSAEAPKDVSDVDDLSEFAFYRRSVKSTLGRRSSSKFTDQT